MIMRILNPQGIAGLAASICLGLLLILQKGETRRWRMESARYEALHRSEQAAFAQTVAGYRAAAERARADDLANAERVAVQQNMINERTKNDFEARLANARAAAGRLRDREAAADPGARGSPPLPRLSAPSGGAAEVAGEDGLSDRLLATEQAIQLDELIRWVKRQAAVDPNGERAAR